MIKFKTFLVNKKLSWRSDWRKEKVLTCDTCYMHKWYMKFEHMWITMVSNLFEFTGMQFMANIFCAEIQNLHIKIWGNTPPPHTVIPTNMQRLYVCVSTQTYTVVCRLELCMSLSVYSLSTSELWEPAKQLWHKWPRLFYHGWVTKVALSCTGLPHCYWTLCVCVCVLRSITHTWINCWMLDVCVHVCAHLPGRICSIRITQSLNVTCWLLTSDTQDCFTQTGASEMLGYILW